MSFGSTQHSPTLARERELAEDAVLFRRQPKSERHGCPNVEYDTRHDLQLKQTRQGSHASGRLEQHVFV